MHDDPTPPPPSPHIPISPKGLKRSSMMWILSAGDSWAGMRRAPDGGFCGGLPFILGCKQPELLYYKWVIYSLLPKPFFVGCFMDFVTKGYQHSWCLWFLWTPWTREKSCRLEHLHVAFHMSCKWVPASPLPQMSSWPLIFRCSLSQLLVIVRPGHLALHFNYSSLWRKISLSCFILLQSRPEHMWTPPSFPPRAPGVLKGLSPVYSFHLCL